jgi:hypothetical protein
MKAVLRLLLVLLPFVADAALAAGDQPWILDANNWQEGKDLLPEPVVKRLQKGEYWFKVVPVDPKKYHDNYAKKFWDLTATNEGKYDLDGATCGLKDKATGKIPEFLVGLPFPQIDPNDPQAGC